MTNPTIIVPYRARPEHLSIFVPAMNKYLPGAPVIVVEQADSKPFNRGKLINCCFLEFKPDYFVAHDVDLIPIDVDYSFSPWVTQLAKSEIQKVDYLGGVTMFTDASFERVGGYNNDFYSRGEDNEVSFNLKRRGIPVSNRFGIFEQLPHPRTGPEFIPNLWHKAQQKRKIQDQLSVCKYKLVSKEQKEGYLHLKVGL